ncbi:DUF317 domain-containing protein [Streptomyces sp. SID1121]|uniref:DUF317 domain-containing protein n=1 Tax=Streptomyces sp. SID1121 TaxID=3425888 RepID=UPI00405661A6
MPWRNQVRIAWHIEVRDCPAGVSQGTYLWHAAFNAVTPEHLVTAFVTALADSAPLQRGMFDRTADHGVVQRPSPLTPQQTVDAYTNRIQALRVLARAARQQRIEPPARAAASHPAARR